jgi:hypothetical protein
MPIGTRHAAQARNIRAALVELRKVSPAEFASGFQALIDRLDGWAARIAAVGQVKAGKSSILNALIGEVGFLPSDVNPWTSVVTNIRLNIPTDPAQGACFEFFDESAWDRIINGEPGMRKLAEEMLPGFDAEVLRRQTEEMRTRAQRRLGRFYATLLGKRHAYDLLSPRLLERYVCAGPGGDEGLEREPTGRYAAITKVADVYRRSAEYAVPTIITDTPGVNDPFLVRDEFTCQALGNSDIFVIMLSAHQALTDVDVALCRMLARQASKDVVVFVNRIDELEDMTAQVDTVLADVSHRIFAAIPERDFTVLCGSAWWAELASQPDTDPELLARIAEDPQLIAFLRNRHGRVPQDHRERLMLASGVPDVKRSLSEAVDLGIGASFLARVVAEARERVGALKAVTQRRLSQVHDQIESWGAGNGADFARSVSDDLRQLEKVRSDLTAMLGRASDQFDLAMNDSWTALQQKLDGHVGAFIDGQRERMAAMWTGTRAERDASVEVDILPLRGALEAEVRDSYVEARGRVDELLLGCLHRANTAARRVLDGADVQVSLAGMPGDDVMAAFSSSRKTLSVALVMKSSWAFWRGRTLDFGETFNALRRITAAEVQPSSMKMVETFTRTLESRAEAGKERLKLVLEIVERSLEDRRERLEETRALVGAAGDREATAERVLTRLQSDSEVLDHRLRLIATKEGVLSRDMIASAA